MDRATLVALSSAIFLSACSEPECGLDEVKIADTCVRSKKEEIADSGARAADASKVADGADGERDEQNDGPPPNAARPISRVDAGDLSRPTDAPTPVGTNDPDAKCTSIREVCDGRDNNCDGRIDEDVTIRCWVDQDGDGYAAAGAKAVESCDACGARQTSQEPGDDKIDCDDTSSSKSPGATDVCGDNIDNDCDGRPDDDMNNACGGPCSAQLAGKPGDPCSNGLAGACAQQGTYECRSDHSLTCNAPKLQPASSEVCGDGSDNDCRGGVDDGCVKNACGGWMPLSGVVGMACTMTKGQCKYPGKYECAGAESLSCAKIPRSSNLVEDSGFEMQNTSAVGAPWTNYKGAAIELSGNAHGGSKNATVFAEPENATVVASWNDIFQVIEVEPSTRYKLQAWVKTSSNTMSGRLGARGVGDRWMIELAEGWGRSFAAVSEYALMSTLFTTTSETSVSVYVGVNTGANGERTTLWVDDLVVTKDDLCAEL